MGRAGVTRQSMTGGGVAFPLAVVCPALAIEPALQLTFSPCLGMDGAETGYRSDRAETGLQAVHRWRASPNCVLTEAFLHTVTPRSGTVFLRQSREMPCMSEGHMGVVDVMRLQPPYMPDPPLQADNALILTRYSPLALSDRHE